MQVLAADLAAVYDCLFSNEALLDKLFAFLEREEPLNSLLAGYFGKIVSVLLARRTDETLKVMEERNLVPQLLRHLGAYSILELLLKVPAPLSNPRRLEALHPGSMPDARPLSHRPSERLCACAWAGLLGT